MAIVEITYNLGIAGLVSDLTLAVFPLGKLLIHASVPLTCLLRLLQQLNGRVFEALSTVANSGINLSLVKV